MLSALDLRRLADRVERLTRVSTHGWNPADETDFKRRLPGARGTDPRRRLPGPARLREWAQQIDRGDRTVLNMVKRNWRSWLQMSLDMESLAVRNSRGNPSRLLRDVSRGRLPKFAALLLEATLILEGHEVHAKTDPQFMQWAQTQTFLHPETKNEVKFVSLPAEEQARIRSRWDQRKQQAETQRERARGEEEPARRSPKREEKKEPPWESVEELESKRFKEWLSEQGGETREVWEGEGGRPAKREIWDRFKKDQAREPTVLEQLERQEKEAPPPRAPEKSQEELAAHREKFMETPAAARPDRWVRVDKGNSLWGSAKLGDHADVSDSRIAGSVEGSAKVEKSSVDTGSRVDGTARVKRSAIKDFSVVEGDAKVTRSTIENRARVRGDTEINNAKIKGGTWDGQKIKDGRGGTFHQAWDQETLDILTSIKPRSAMFGYAAPPGVPGTGDSPLLSMVHYLRDGGRTKGWLGGEFKRDKLVKRIQDHVYTNYDQKHPWMGRGASHLDDVSEEDFEKLMDVAQKEADRLKAEDERKKKAMLHHLAKTALENPDLRPGLMPLVRLARDSRVASGRVDLRRLAIRFAYEHPNSRVRTAIVEAVRAGDGATSSHPRREEGLEISPEQFRTLVRVAYTTPSPERRRRIVGMLRQAKYSPGFLKWVEKRKFTHPETKNEVKFVSLPPAERTKVHEQWKAGKKQWAQQFKPKGLGKETELTPEKFDALEEGDTLWISWAPTMRHRVTGFEKTKTGKPVVEMALVDPKTGKDIETRYLHRSSAGDPKHDIHIVPKEGEKKEPEEKKKEPEEKKKEPEKPKAESGKLPGPAAVWKEMKESGLMEKLVPGAKATNFVSEYERGDKITATGPSGTTGEFTVLGKFVIKGKDGTEYVLAQGEHGPTVVPFQGPKAKGVKIQKGEKEPPKKTPHEEAKERVEKTHPETLPKLSEEKGEALDNEVAALINDWEGGPSDFKHLETVGKKYYGDNFDANAHKAMLGWVSDWFDDVAKDLHDEDPDRASYFQEVADDVRAKAETVKPKEPEKTEAPKPTGKYKDRKELVGAPAKKGDADTKIEGTMKLVDLAAPEGMDPEVRKETAKRMKDLTLGQAQKLIGNLDKAIEKPDGLYAKALIESGYTMGDIQKLHKALRARVRPYEGRKYAEPVLEMANKYDLESEDADELYDFKADKPAFGKKLTDAELMQKFLSKAKPETKERMQGMSLADFMVMYKSIMAEEDEEEGEEAA